MHLLIGQANKKRIACSSEYAGKGSVKFALQKLFFSSFFGDGRLLTV